MASVTQQSGHQQASTPIFPEVPLVGDPLWIAWAQNMNDFLAAVTKTFNMPGLVTNVTATANNLVTLLQWNATNDASMYRIYRNTSGDFDSAAIIGTVPASKTGVATLTYQDGKDQTTSSPTRFYWVSGINERGIEGPKSAMVSVSNYATSSTGAAAGVNALAGDRGVAVGVDADSTNVTDGMAFGYQATPEFNFETVFGSTASPLDVFGFVAGANGQKFRIFAQEQVLTINAAASTASTTFFNAADIVLGVSTRVTVTIPTAATYNVTLTTTGTTLAGSVSTAANTTDIGTLNCPVRATAVEGVTITPDVMPANNNGRVRITAYCYRLDVPTS